MAKAERKKKLNRLRVQKHRQKNKLMSEYENAVRSEIQKRNRDTRNHNLHANEMQNGLPNENSTFNLENALQNWAFTHRVTHMAVKDLLSILNAAGVSPEFGKLLPKDSRTLLKTPVHVDIKQLSHGKLWYHGVQTCLKKILKNVNRDVSATLNFNFDGVPLYESSNICFWPILSSIKGIPL